MIRSFLQHLKHNRIIRLDPTSTSRGTVVISYMREPFMHGYDSLQIRGHTNAYECFVMAESYRDLGFAVEIIDYTDTHYTPPSSCVVAIDIHSNLERWDAHLSNTCIRLLHATGPHWLLTNQAELTRLRAIRDRKGIALKPRRQSPPSRGIEVAHQATVLGNAYTIASFQFAGKPITRIPISSAYTFPWPKERNMATARHRFLWVGSYGMVFKGLDLVLEAFAQLPHLQLTVCGRPEKEEDFYQLYQQELQHTPNIHCVGWMDMASPAFAEIARTHAAIIYPSSAEGGAGSVIHCMHAGMIPITTREASIDLGDFGISIPTDSVEAVKTAALACAQQSPHLLEQQARASYEHVQCVHTRQSFQTKYVQFAKQLTEIFS